MDTPELRDVASMAINLQATEGALDSAALLLSMIGPRYREMHPATLHAVDPESGTLSDAAVSQILASLSDDLDTVVDLLTQAHEILVTVTERAVLLYPRA